MVVAATNIEKDIAAAILRAEGSKVSTAGLRFDRVVLRVLGDLRAFADGQLPEDMAAVVTISAPIQAPAKTVATLQDRMGAMLAAHGPAGDHRGEAHGNAVSLRLVDRASPQGPKLVGFVHNRGVDARALVDLAERWLRRPS